MPKQHGTTIQTWPSGRGYEYRGDPWTDTRAITDRLRVTGFDGNGYTVGDRVELASRDGSVDAWGAWRTAWGGHTGRTISGPADRFRAVTS